MDRQQRRALIGAALLFAPFGIDCSPPVTRRNLDPNETLEAGPGDGASVDGFFEITPLAEPARAVQVTTTAILPDDGSIQLLPGLDTVYGSVFASARNFTQGPVITAGTGFTGVIPAGPDPASFTAVVDTRFVLDVATDVSPLEVVVRPEALLATAPPAGSVLTSLVGLASCAEPRSPLGVTVTALAPGQDSRLLLQPAAPSGVSWTAQCLFDLQTQVGSSAPGITGQIFNLQVLSIGRPQNQPPQVSAIVANFVPVQQTTYYSVNAADPDGNPLAFDWSGPDCGSYGATAPGQFSWFHPHPPCDPTTSHSHVTIVLQVSDGIDTVECQYAGAHSGVGPACTLLPRP